MTQLIITLIIATAAGIAGTGLGWFLRFITALGRKGSTELEIKEMIILAREESEKIIREARKESKEFVEKSSDKIEEDEERLQKNQDRLARKETILDKRQIDLDEEEEELKVIKKETENKLLEVDEILTKRITELSSITNLSEEEAKENLLEIINKRYEEDLMVRIQKLERVSKDKMEDRAKEILATTIQRLSNPVSSDVFSSTVSIPKEEIKGKIIGKEGRNIKTFERETGVELVIDESPDTIMISSFNPVRREVAKLALEKLIEDGRIQPAKIEREVEKAKKEINSIIKECGESAAYKVKIFNLDPKIMLILGRLHFRTSYGQNVLQHSIEVAHLAGMIAEELGADPQVARAGGLVHDIGKAVDHEVSGTHVEIGRRILQKFGADEKIIQAMQSHHDEYPYETIESVIVQVADSISGSRPGARRDSVDNYLKRLEDLEELANSFKGVSKAYALQAGREIRIFVTPDDINDVEAKELSHKISKKIENELSYPGEIKITIIRETRVVEYAR